jgi:hypothetical protein
MPPAKTGTNPVTARKHYEATLLLLAIICAARRRGVFAHEAVVCLFMKSRTTRDGRNERMEDSSDHGRTGHAVTNCCTP